MLQVSIFLILSVARLYSEGSQAPPPDLSCGVQPTPPVRVTFHTQRNLTGQWISQIGLEHKKWMSSMLMETTMSEDSDTVYIVATVSRSPPKSTPPGYQAIGGAGNYKFHAVGMTWSEARDRCAAEGSHLVIINSEKEARAIVLLFALHPKVTDAENHDWAWTGVRELGVNEQYYTLHGDHITTTGYSRWIPSKHNITEVNNCVLAQRSTGSLTDYYCDHKFAHICELEFE